MPGISEIRWRSSNPGLKYSAWPVHVILRWSERKGSVNRNSLWLRAFDLKLRPASGHTCVSSELSLRRWNSNDSHKDSKQKDGYLTKAVLNAHHHGVGEIADEPPVVQRFGGWASYEIPSMDPHHHRQGFQEGGGEINVQRHKNVEVQTVFTDLWEI